MKRKIGIILICLFILTMGCQKENLYSDTEKNITELSNLQLVKSNNPFVNEIVGSRAKSTTLNDKVEYEYPWLLDIEEDNKDRVIFCIESDDDFIDRKMVYVKDGDHKFSYIIERAYVYSKAPSIEDIKADSISTFTGILTIFTPDKTPLYSYFYSKNELVGETDFHKEINSLKSLKTAPIDGGMKNEVIVYGAKPNRTKSSAGNVWFIRNGGRTTGVSSSNSNYSTNSHNGGGNISNSNPSKQNTYTNAERAALQLNYLRLRGESNLAEILSALLNDPNLTEREKEPIYLAIQSAYFNLMGRLTMAIMSPENIGTILSFALIPNITKTVQNKVFKLASLSREKVFQRMAIQLRDALNGKGDFGIGSATRKEAMEMGKAWVGEGYLIKSQNNMLIWKSANKARQFRFGIYRGKTVGRFQRTDGPSKAYKHNGHLIITN